MDILTILGILIVIVSVALAGIATLTLTLSWIFARNTARRKTCRDRMREELFYRFDNDENDWSAWVTTLTEEEQTELGRIVLRYLRLVTGSERRKYLQLAGALSLGEKAHASLENGEYYPRLEALTTLTYLDYPLSIDYLLSTSQGYRQSREAAARLLYHRREEYEDAHTIGTQMLIGSGTEALSVYGLKTLAALNAGRETPILALAADAHHEWDRGVLIQICLVVEQTPQMGSDTPVAWIADLTTADDPAIRSAAIRAMKRLGHRDTVRNSLDIHALITDSAPDVRRNTYEILAYWGDRTAIARLESALITETDPRCQLTAIRGLLSQQTIPEWKTADWPQAAYKWVRAEIDVADSTRLPVDDLQGEMHLG